MILLKIIAFTIFVFDGIQKNQTQHHCGWVSSRHIRSYITEKAFDMSCHFEKFCLCLPNQKEWVKYLLYSIDWKSLLVPSLNKMKFKVTLPDSTVGRRLLYISVVILLKKPLMWALILKSSVYACLIKKSRWNVFSVFALCRSGWLGKLQKMISFARPPLAFPFKYLIWKSQRNYQHFYTFTAPRCLIFSRMIYIEKESRLLVYDIPNPL